MSISGIKHPNQFIPFLLLVVVVIVLHCKSLASHPLSTPTQNSRIDRIVSITNKAFSFPPGSSLAYLIMAEKGRPLPKFGEWDVNDPASAEGYTMIFNKARDEKKGGSSDSSAKKDSSSSGSGPKAQPKKWLCCVQAPDVHT